MVIPVPSPINVMVQGDVPVVPRIAAHPLISATTDYVIRSPVTVILIPLLLGSNVGTKIPAQFPISAMALAIVRVQHGIALMEMNAPMIAV